LRVHMVNEVPSNNCQEVAGSIPAWGYTFTSLLTLYNTSKDYSKSHSSKSL